MYFYSGMLFNKTFIKLRDYWTDSIYAFVDGVVFSIRRRSGRLGLPGIARFRLAVLDRCFRFGCRLL